MAVQSRPCPARMAASQGPQASLKTGRNTDTGPDPFCKRSLNIMPIGNKQMPGEGVGHTEEAVLWKLLCVHQKEENEKNHTEQRDWGTQSPDGRQQITNSKGTVKERCPRGRHPEGWGKSGQMVGTWSLLLPVCATPPGKFCLFS